MFASPFQAYILLKASFILIASFYKKTIKYTDYFEIVFIFLKNSAETTIGKESEAKTENIILLK